LNKHIENYKEMQTIFGNDLATGKYAMGSNEALGSPYDFADSSIKAEPYDEDMVAKSMDAATAKISAEVGKDTKEESTGASKKRKRSVFSEEDHMVMAGLTEAVKDVASAICETKVEVLNPDLYGAVMYMAGFNEEVLLCAFSHLTNNKAQSDAFVKMTDSHRVLWLRTWLAKHYYM
jgi:hypothetical protein